MIYTEEEIAKYELMQYIDFQAICEDFDLDEGGLSPEQYMTFENLLIEFIIQNKWQKQDE